MTPRIIMKPGASFKRASPAKQFHVDSSSNVSMDAQFVSDRRRPRLILARASAFSGQLYTQKHRIKMTKCNRAVKTSLTNRDL